MGPENLVKQDEEQWIEQLPEKVDDCITKFKLYETKSNFYMIGRNKSKTVWRVLKIGRTETSELSITEDPTRYSEKQCKELLQRLADGNQSSGGLVFVTKCYGIVGFIRFLGPYYMLLITKKSNIGNICGHAVFSVTESMIIPVPYSIDECECDKTYSKKENRYLKLLKAVELTKDFIFSYSYNIMLSLQKNLSNYKPRMEIYETMFVWNEYLTRGIRNQLKNSMWTVALVHGFFKQATYRVSGREFTLTLIARRSRHYAGTRYLKRGVNEKGRVANDVETEQIVSRTVRGVTHITSVVQNRGSIPLFWSQQTSKLFIKPDIILSRKDSMYNATKLHFQNLKIRYGNPILIINLIKGHEKKPRESVLRSEFINAIDVINKELPVEDELKYLHWDLSKHSKKDPFALEQLVDLSARAVEFTGIFRCQLPPTSQTKNSLNLPESKDHLAEKGADTQRPVDDTKRPVDDFATRNHIFPRNDCGDFHTNPPTFQKGVVRTNCIDCLDRTNVAQYAYGLAAIGQQLHSIGFVNPPCTRVGSSLSGILMKFYEEMGDTLALQYGGSEAHNKIFSEKRGQWKAATQSQGLIKSLKRYCSNVYFDAEKQNAINVFLGHFKPAVWESDSDTHHIVGRQDNEFANEKTSFEGMQCLANIDGPKRLNIRRSLSDGVMVRESSTLEEESVGKEKSLDQQKLETELANLPVSESAPEISDSDGNPSCSRHTRSGSRGKKYYSAQHSLVSRNSSSLSDLSESFDSSNFVDIDEFCSSSEDLYERSSFLGSSWATLSCLGGRSRSYYRSRSSSLSRLGNGQSGDDLEGDLSPVELCVSGKEAFEQWVANGDTFSI